MLWKKVKTKYSMKHYSAPGSHENVFSLTKISPFTTLSRFLFSQECLLTSSNSLVNFSLSSFSLSFIKQNLARTGNFLEDWVEWYTRNVSSNVRQGCPFLFMIPYFFCEHLRRRSTKHRQEAECICLSFRCNMCPETES